MTLGTDDLHLRRTVETFEISSEDLRNAGDTRLDASFYNPYALKAISDVRASGMNVRPLSELVERVFFPTRFKRNYVAKDRGVKFLQGSHIVQYDPDDIKYLSRVAHDLDPILLKSGWIVMTRSGTAGRVALVPRSWDGWAASEHLLRIVPKRELEHLTGFLASYLASEYGRAQISAQVFGAVVDEIAEKHLGSVKVPVPTTKSEVRWAEEVNNLAIGAAEKRAQSTDVRFEAQSLLSELLGQQDDFEENLSFNIGYSRLVSAPERRLDARFYGEGAVRALAALDECSMRLVTVGDLAERVFMPGRFKRHFVAEGFGQPFLRGANVVEFRPDNIKYLSSAVHTNLKDLTVQEDWILVTRSGTVGRVAIVPREWDGWAATEDVIRVVPSDKCNPHYLATFLASPLGKIQLVRQTFGAVVDHLTESHIRSVMVPMPRTAEQSRIVRRISDLAKEASDLRSRAVRDLGEAEGLITSRFKTPTTP